MTYIFSMSERAPNRIYFNRSSGQIHTTHMYPSKLMPWALSSLWPITHLLTRMSGVSALLKDAEEFGHHEAVPFRFTPNIQTFLTRPNIEGLLTGCIMAIAQALTEDEVNTCSLCQGDILIRSLVWFLIGILALVTGWFRVPTIDIRQGWGHCMECDASDQTCAWRFENDGDGHQEFGKCD